MPQVKTVGEHVVARLGEWGVRRYYGYPGDGIGGVLGALRKAGEAAVVQVSPGPVPDRRAERVRRSSGPHRPDRCPPACRVRLPG